MKSSIFAIGLGLIACPVSIAAQEASSDQVTPSRDATISDHLRALENLDRLPLDAFLASFENERLSPELRSQFEAGEMQALLRGIHQVAENAGGANISVDDDTYILSLRGPRSLDVSVQFADHPPFAITALSANEPAPLPQFSLETVVDQIDAIMTEGNHRGLVFIERNREILMNRTYGLANAELGTPITPDTIFGVGSRPIDFTKAAIHLLVQRGQLSLTDTLADHFENVPEDRAGMTIEHMMTGRSGLPDFPAQEGDTDPDLGWITKEEFVSRTMAIELLFAPGEGREHSHWAFGVLAAIVENVSGMEYSAFLRENFFDPAGMDRTGNYGESRGLALSDFAVGGGEQVGLPNIPPNWGPTSWLVKGSGGMFSTLNDLRRFYGFVRSSGVLNGEHAAIFDGPQVQLDGSVRGFELFSFSNHASSTSAYLFLADGSGPETIRRIGGPLARMLESD